MKCIMMSVFPGKKKSAMEKSQKPVKDCHDK